MANMWKRLYGAFTINRHYSGHKPLLVLFSLVLSLLWLVPQISIAEGTTIVRTAAWSPDGMLLAIGGIVDGQAVARLYNENDQLLEQFQTNTFNVLSIDWSPNQGLISITVTHELGTAYQVWDVNDGQLVSSFEQEGETLDSSTYWHPDSRRLATVNGYAVYVRDALSGTILNTFRQVNSNADTIQAVVWGADGLQLYTVSGDNIVRSWDLTSSTLLWETSLDDYLYSISLSRDGSKLAVAGGSEVGYVIDVANGVVVNTFSIGANFGVSTLYWYPGDTQIASADNRGGVNITNLQTGQQISVVQGDVNLSLEDVDFTNYGGRLAYAIRSIGEPTLNASQEIETLSGNSGQSIAGGAVQIVVPDPSPERLQAIAAACDAPPQVVQAITAAAAANDAQTPDAMSALMDTVEALPADAIPPGCAADLRAVAEAIAVR